MFVYLQEEEKRMRDEYIAFQQQELEKQLQKKRELAQLENSTKKRLAHENKGLFHNLVNLNIDIFLEFSLTRYVCINISKNW